jgi:hypothetical protein
VEPDGGPDVRAYLDRAVFPAERSRLVAEAIAAGAPEEIVEDLRSLPDDHLFGSRAEVADALTPSTRERLEP